MKAFGRYLPSFPAQSNEGATVVPKDGLPGLQPSGKSALPSRWEPRCKSQNPFWMLPRISACRYLCLNVAESVSRKCGKLWVGSGKAYNLLPKKGGGGGWTSHLIHWMQMKRNGGKIYFREYMVVCLSIDNLCLNKRCDVFMLTNVIGCEYWIKSGTTACHFSQSAVLWAVFHLCDEDIILKWLGKALV